jgi:hypothetical protein
MTIFDEGPPVAPLILRSASSRVSKDEASWFETALRASSP